MNIYYHAECHSDDCHLAECHSEYCHSDDGHLAERHSDHCHFAGSFVECHYDGYHSNEWSIILMSKVSF